MTTETAKKPHETGTAGALLPPEMAVAFEAADAAKAGRMPLGSVSLDFLRFAEQLCSLMRVKARFGQIVDCSLNKREAIMTRQHWQDRLVFGVGLWLIVSNWIFDFSIPEGTAATISGVVHWNFIATGVVGLIFGYATLISFHLWEEFANIALGTWLVASPWMLGFATMTTAAWNAIPCGVMIILSAAWTLYEERELEGSLSPIWVYYPWRRHSRQGKD